METKYVSDNLERLFFRCPICQYLSVGVKFAEFARVSSLLSRYRWIPGLSVRCQPAGQLHTATLLDCHRQPSILQTAVLQVPTSRIRVIHPLSLSPLPSPILSPFPLEVAPLNPAKASGRPLYALPVVSGTERRPKSNLVTILTMLMRINWTNFVLFIQQRQNIHVTSKRGHCPVLP